MAMYSQYTRRGTNIPCRSLAYIKQCYSTMYTLRRFYVVYVRKMWYPLVSAEPLMISIVDESGTLHQLARG